MARIESIERRQIAAIAAEIERQLGAAADVPGIASLTMPVELLDDVERWRHAVRVGRRHGWRVRTGITQSVAWATDLREPPADVRQAMAERAIERLDALTTAANSPPLTVANPRNRASS